MFARHYACILISFLLFYSVDSANLKFELVASHDETPADLAAQGTAMFLSALTGLDFTRWQTKLIGSTPTESKFDIVADVPDAEKDRIDENVNEYISSGTLNKDYAKYGYPDVKVAFRNANEVKINTSKSAKENISGNLDKKSSEGEAKTPANSTTNNSMKSEEKSNPTPSTSPEPKQSSPKPKRQVVAVTETISAVEENYFVSDLEPQATDEVIERVQESPEIIEELPLTVSPGKSELSAALSVETTEPTDDYAIPENEHAVSELAQRNFSLTEGEILSEKILLETKSPVFGFPSDLGDAIKWLISNATGTDDRDYLLWDVYETSETTFIAAYRFIGKPSDVKRTVSDVKKYVSNGGLTREINEIEPSGEFEVTMFEGNLSGVKSEITNDISPEASNEPFRAIAIPDTQPTVADNEDILELPLNVYSPSSGFSAELNQEIAEFSAKSNSIPLNNWRLVKAQSTEEEGYFDIEYNVVVEKDSKQEVSNSVVQFIRERKLEEYLDTIGFEEVEVRLLPQLLNSSLDLGNNNRGPLKSSTATIVASVVGVALIIAMGIIVAICCLPKKDRPS